MIRVGATATFGRFRLASQPEQQQQRQPEQPSQAARSSQPASQPSRNRP